MHPTTRALRTALAAVAVAITAPLMTACVPSPDDLAPAPPCSALSACDVPAPPCSALSACDPAPSPALELDRALFSQQQAVEGFDDQTYVVDDEAALDELASLLAVYGVDEDYESAPSDEVGGRSTLLTVITESGSTVTIDIMASDDMTSFEAELDALVTEWHDDGGFPTADLP